MMRKKLPVSKPMEASLSIPSQRPWRVGPLAVATILTLAGGAHNTAFALALGRVNVQSALGEALRAEIDILEISADETSSLRANVASTDAFKAAGLEYNSSLAALQITLQKRPDGRSYLRLSSDRIVNEPFVDLILEANWSSGRIVRDYTMLFDPPNLRPQAAAVTPQPPQIAAAMAAAPATAARAIGSGSAAKPDAANAPVTSPAGVKPIAAPRAKPAAKSAAPATVAQAAGTGTVTVKPGDTAGKIAALNKPDTVSLDQMLLALLSSNPQAFIGGDINRVKSGAVLNLPSAELAAATPAQEARKSIIAQSRNFNEFRRKLAGAAPTAQAAGTDRTTGGKVEARVQDRKPSEATPDKLTLAKGAVQGKATAEEKIAKDRQTKEASQRVAELSKNIADLNKLGAGPSASAASAANPAKAALALPVGAGTPVAATATPASAAKMVAAATPASAAKVAVAVTPASAAVKPALVAPSAPPAAIAPPASAAAAVAASAPAQPIAALAVAVVASAVAPAVAPASAAAAGTSSASAAAQPASARTPDPAAKAPVIAASAPKSAPVAAPEPSFIDELLDNSYVLIAAVLLLLGLGGFGFYRFRQRKNGGQVDSSFLESRLQPDSFFGASGGQRIDTQEGSATGSSMVYSPSQLDAAGDVDPVAEADVYLAYGRDLQAEEILKEAMRVSPSRVAIHGKLLEIYAKRRDAKAFEIVAIEVFGLTKGQGSDWEQASGLGRDLDPSNAMYRAGGSPANASASIALAASAAGATMAFASNTVPQMAAPELAPPSGDVDFDLDLDFSLGDDPAPAPQAIGQQTVPLMVQPTTADHGMDLDLVSPQSRWPSRICPHPLTR